MAPKLAPNLFELNAESVTVTYSTTSIDGTPRFTYTKGRQTLNFAGTPSNRKASASARW